MKQKTHLLLQVSISPGRGASNSTPRSGPALRSTAARFRPSRSRESRSCSCPAWKWKSMTSRRAWPLMATMRSPGRRAARAAGERSRTAATTTPAGVGLAQAVMLEIARVIVPGERVRRVELPEPLHQVLEPGTHREDCGDPGRRPGQEHESAEVVGEHGGQHGGHLEHRGGLAEEARGGMHGAPRHVNDEHAHAQDEVAAHYHRGDPEGDDLEIRQGDEGRGDEELVSHGIEEGAEPGLRAPHTRDVAIEHV